jgi:hypothetical protein
MLVIGDASVLLTKGDAVTAIVNEKGQLRHKRYRALLISISILTS